MLQIVSFVHSVGLLMPDISLERFEFVDEERFTKFDLLIFRSMLRLAQPLTLAIAEAASAVRVEQVQNFRSEFCAPEMVFF